MGRLKDLLIGTEKEALEKSNIPIGQMLENNYTLAMYRCRTIVEAIKAAQEKEGK